MKIKKNDTVYIAKGKDAGRSGKVIKVWQEGRVTIDGLNLIKKSRRPRREGERGEIVSLPQPIESANVRLVCPACHEPTKIGSRLSNKTKERYCKKCQATI